MKKLFLLPITLILFSIASCTDTIEIQDEAYAHVLYASVHNKTAYTAEVSATIRINSGEPQVIKLHVYAGGGTEAIQMFEYKTSGSQFTFHQKISDLLPFHGYELHYFLNENDKHGDAFYFEEFGTLNSYGEGLINLDDINLIINDMNYDSMRDVIYAAIPGSDKNGNSIAVINAKTHEAKFIKISKSPIKLSRYGSYLWIACSNGSIQKMNISTLVIEENFQVYLPGDTSTYYVDDLEAIPGHENKIAVSLKRTGVSPRFKAVAIYEFGKILPNYVTGHSGSNTIEYANGSLWGYNNETSGYELYQYDIDNNGIEIDESYKNIIQGYNLELYEYDDILYTTYGHVVETDAIPSMKSLIDGDFSQNLVIDPWGKNIIFINDDEDGLLVYNLENYSFKEEIKLDKKYYSFEKILCTGINRYVITTKGGEVIFYN